MTIGSIIAGTLPLLQSQAESMMQDECVVTGPGGEPVWNDEQGAYVAPPGGTVYAGRCQVPKTNPAAQDADAGETNWAKGFVALKVPARLLEGDEGDPRAITDGHRVTVTSTTPPLELDVRFVVPQTFEKSRKVACEVVTRDAG